MNLHSPKITQHRIKTNQTSSFTRTKKKKKKKEKEKEKEKEMQMFIGLTLMFVMSLNCIESIPLKDPLPPASNITANVTWTFASGSSVTNVILTVANLKASQYTAIGLGQNQSMV